MEKTVPRRNSGITRANRLLHAGTSFDSCIYLMCRTINVNILSSAFIIWGNQGVSLSEKIENKGDMTNCNDLLSLGYKRREEGTV